MTQPTPTLVDLATHLGDTLQARTPTPAELPALFEALERILGFLARAHVAHHPEGPAHQLAHTDWEHAAAALRVLYHGARVRAREDREAREAADALLADAQDAGLYVLDRETEPAPREPDPESEALALACVEASLGPAKAVLAEADAAIAASRELTRAKRDTGFRLMSRERVAEIGRMGGKSSAERRRERRVA
jgi:hypothetical protein